jgi:hypothetical protein
MYLNTLVTIDCLTCIVYEEHFIYRKNRLLQTCLIDFHVINSYNFGLDYHEYVYLFFSCAVFMNSAVI